jgi:hypothetical protein
VQKFLHSTENTISRSRTEILSGALAIGADSYIAHFLFKETNSMVTGWLHVSTVEKVEHYRHSLEEGDKVCNLEWQRNGDGRVTGSAAP